MKMGIIIPNGGTVIPFAFSKAYPLTETDGKGKNGLACFFRASGKRRGRGNANRLKRAKN